MTGRPSPPMGREIDFDVIEEHWNEYEAENGRVLIRARAILTRLFQHRENELGASAQFIVTARSLNADMKGPPSNEQISVTNRKYAVQFQPVSEPWNIYRTRGPNSKMIRTRLVVSNIERLAAKFDNLGEPAYFVSHQMVVGPPIDSTNPTA